MKRIIPLIASLILVLSTLSFSAGMAAPAQEIARNADPNLMPGSIIRFEHLTIEDGLSQNAGLALFQDHQGYLWIGTQDGLNRYDGYDFKAFKHDPEDPTSLSNNGILALGEDRDARLWIGTWGGGLDRFDPATETFVRYGADPDAASSLSNNVVTSIKRDSSGALWVGTLGGLNRYNPATDGFDHFTHDPDDPESLSSDAISVIFEDANRQLWIGTGAFGIEGAGLNRFDPSTGKVVRYSHNEDDPHSISSNNISSIYESPDGNFWIATGGFSLPGGGLNQFDPRTGMARHFSHDPATPDSLSSNELMTLWGDSTGILWVGTWSAGLERMELAKPGHFVHYQNDPYFPESLSGNEVWSLYKDRSGVLWIGTSHSGINKLPANSGQFNLYRNNPGDPASLSANAIGAFSEDRHGNIWIATWGAGLERLDLTSGQFTHFRHDPAEPESLSDDLFMDVHVDESGIVWAGTLGKGLDALHPMSGRVTHYIHDPADPASLADDNVAAILPDGTGGLWIGTFGGLAHYDPETSSFTNYSNDPAEASSLGENKVVSLHLDTQRNILWIGTWGGGLSRLDLNDPLYTDPARATFKHYRHDPDDPVSLGEDSVWAIHQARDGSLWLGTQLGLNHFDPQAGTFTRYTEKNGLPNNVVLGILEDDSGDLWLTTNNGLAQFDPGTRAFTAYDTTDGLQSNEFNSNAYYRARSGLMYVGGINGFNIFDPAGIRPNPVPPPVALTGFEVFNQPVAVDLSCHRPIELSYSQDFITFEFAAFDFQAPQKNHYAYRLEGFDEDWIEAGNRRYATYTNLPGGEYVFRVKASNSDGIWNETGVAIPVFITPPVWQTWWFNGGLILALGALVAAGFRWRLDSVRERNIRLEAEVAERISQVREANRLLEKEIEQRKRAEAELAERAAAELQQSEERFRAAFESSAIGMALLTLEGRILRANAAVCKMSGYSEEELQQRFDQQNAYPADRDVGMDRFAELLEGRRDSYQVEKRYVRKNGEVFWTRLTISALRDGERKAENLVAMVEDIDQQKRTSAELLESEERFRAMFENAGIGIALVGLDRRPQMANTAMIEMTGYSRDEFFRMSGADLSYHEDADIGMPELQRVLAGELNSYQIEKRYVRKGGQIYWVRLTNSVVCAPDGRPQYFVTMVEDINDQKQAADELRRSQARFQAIFDNVAVGVAVMGLDRRPIAFNATTERIVGYSFKELQNIDPRSLAVPEDRGMDVELFRDLVAGKRTSYVMERRYVRRDGSVFWARINYSLVRDLEGHPDYLIGIIEDIDEQKRAEERFAEQEAEYLLTLQQRVMERTHELEQANQRLQNEIERRARIEKELAEKAAEEAVTADRTRLARDLHDAVTQTLFSASLIAEVLPDLWEMDVNEARSSTEELRQLTRGALAEMRTLLLELRPATLTQTRLSDLLRQLCEAFIGRSRLPITLNIEGERSLPPEVQVAYYRIAQESLNNVFKYARATRVDVSLSLSPSGARFEVCDNGIGFDTSATRPTSLGMRIMRERAEAIGAAFHLSSTPGAGTCIEVTWNENPNRKLHVL